MSFSTPAAQAFTPATSGKRHVWHVALARTSSAAGTLTLRLHPTGKGGVPTGSALASSVGVAQSGLPVGRTSWVRFAFPSPASLIAGRAYAAVISTTSKSGGIRWARQAEGSNPYAGGASWTRINYSWIRDRGNDLQFLDFAGAHGQGSPLTVESPYGVCSHPMWNKLLDGTPSSDQDRVREYDAAAAMGAKWMRVDVGWNAIEPQKGCYEFWVIRWLDRVVANLRQRGIEPIISVMGTPQWARPPAHRSDLYAPPANSAYYADFVQRMAAFYKGRVRVWEIWNEPNTRVYWHPQANAAQYAGLLAGAYHGIKQVDRYTVVAGPALSNNDTDYIRSLYAAGAKGHFDVFSLHPYCYPRSPYHVYPAPWYHYDFGGISQVRATMASNGDSSPIWITEFGYTTAANPTRGVSDATQSEYLMQAYRRISEETAWNVQLLCWYNLRDGGSDPANVEYNFGLLTKDFRQKPAYAGYRSIAVGGSSAPALVDVVSPSQARQH